MKKSSTSHHNSFRNFSPSRDASLRWNLVAAKAFNFSNMIIGGNGIHELVAMLAGLLWIAIAHGLKELRAEGKRDSYIYDVCPATTSEIISCCNCDKSYSLLLPPVALLPLSFFLSVEHNSLLPPPSDKTLNNKHRKFTTHELWFSNGSFPSRQGRLRSFSFWFTIFQLENVTSCSSMFNDNRFISILCLFSSGEK